MAKNYPTRHERLTKTVVEAIEPPVTGHIIVWDAPRVGERRGFGIRINSGGARTYFAQGRLPGGREVKPTIGRHGAPWTTEQARAKAKALLGAMAAGTDPTEAKPSASVGSIGCGWPVSAQLTRWGGLWIAMSTPLLVIERSKPSPAQTLMRCSMP